MRLSVSSGVVRRLYLCVVVCDCALLWVDIKPDGDRLP
jgi:hypothetical protein